MRTKSLRLTQAVFCMSIIPLGFAVEGSALAAQQSGANDSAAEAPRPLIAHSPATELSISLDGRLDESVWQDATPISDFTQQEPVEGGQPSEKTEIRVVFDADNLYIGAVIYDDPDGILAFQRERDAGLGTDDRFMWILDTFLDGRTGYFFEINAAGLMGDGVIGGWGRTRRRWRRRPGQQSVGRDLGSPHVRSVRWLVGRDPDSLPDPQL